MKAIRRKLLLMILSFTIILMTALATTFAWIGIFTYASTSDFDINLKVVDLAADYFLEISSTGESGTFSDSVDISDIKKQILENMGKDVSSLESNSAIDIAYRTVANELNPVTTLVNDDNSFSDFLRMGTSDFETVHNPITHKQIPLMLSGEGCYLCFDLYLSVNTKEGISSNTEINAPVFLTDLEETIIGNLTSHRMLMYDTSSGHDFRNIDYSSETNEDLLNCVPILTKAASSRVINLNSKNVVRIGFEVFEAIDINDEYNDDNKIVSNYIFSEGGKYTSYDATTDSYDLGGILPTNYNTAAQEFMNTKTYYEVNVPDEYVSRNDLQLNEENNQIWVAASDLSSTSKYLGVHNGVQTKIKLRTYLWFEGWDADCVFGIHNTDVTFNLTFTASLED